METKLAEYKIPRWKSQKVGMKWPSMDEEETQCGPSIAKYYSVIKRNKALTYATTWVNQENLTLSEKPDTRAHIVYDSIDMKHPEQANPWTQKAD